MIISNQIGIPFQTAKVSGSVSAFTGILDTYTGATVAFSTRWLNSAYTGALIRIRRSSDNAEKDFYPDTNNELSMSSEDGAGTSLSSWITTDSGYIVRWYDQSTAGGTGSGNDMTQATAALQPRVVNAGSLEVSSYNGKAAINQSSGNMTMALTSSIATTQLCYAHHVFDRASTGVINAGLQGTSGASGEPTTYVWFSNDGIYTRVGGTAITLHDASQTQTGDFILTTLRDSSDNVKYWINGTAKTTKVYANSAQNYQRYGVYYQDNQKSQELIYWNSDQESNQSGIESDANTYFNVF